MQPYIQKNIRTPMIILRLVTERRTGSQRHKGRGNGSI